MQQPKRTKPQDPLMAGRQRFAAALREAREETGLSQRQLASQLASRGLRLDPSAITRMEKGTRPVRVEEAMLIARTLDVTVSSLVGEEDVDPLSFLTGLRHEADDQMNSVRRSLASWLRSLSQIQDLLVAHPELLEELGPEDGRPERAEDYLPWVKDRVQGLARDVVLVASEDVAMQLSRIAFAALESVDFMELDDYRAWIGGIERRGLGEGVGFLIPDDEEDEESS